MDSKSYIINELNKLSNTSTSIVAKVGEGLSTNLNSKIEILKKLHAKQISLSEHFDTFSDKLIPFQTRLSNTFDKVDTYYNGCKEIKPILDGFQIVSKTLINQANSFVETEKITRESTRELTDILLHTIASNKLDSTFFFTFKNNIENFLNTGLTLQNKLVDDYSNSVNSFINNSNKIMEEADFIMNFYILENGSFRYGIYDTVQVVNNLVEMLNIFN